MHGNAMPQRKPLSPAALTAVFAVAIAAFGTVVTLWSRSVPEGVDQPLGLTAFITVGVLVLIPATVWLVLKAWSRMDEAAREAHKWAWYWGGALGIIPGFVIANSRSLGLELAGRLGFTEPSELIEFGGVAVLLSMLVGYLLAWGLWWFRRR